MSTILYDNFTSRYQRQADAMIAEARDRAAAAGLYEPPAPSARHQQCGERGGRGGQNARTLRYYDIVNTLAEPFTCQDFIAAVHREFPAVPAQNLISWISSRARNGQLVVISPRRVNFNFSTYRRATPRIEARREWSRYRGGSRAKYA